ncbi:hypothetical protein Tco_0977246 [Tanacetum coccineum]|uniref:Uncharacterized protein n=1 Tax=Tanacetum coccineum TaxID=301880 RepID=A0ABQ5EJL8_9ASTR
MIQTWILLYSPISPVNLLVIGSTNDEVNESTVSQVSEISIDENQTEVQLNESVEIIEDCPATESVKSNTRMKRSFNHESCMSLCIIDFLGNGRLGKQFKLQTMKEIVEIINDDNKRSQDVAVENIRIDENQTEVQLNESVEIIEDCPATESVKSKHENEEILFGGDSRPPMLEKHLYDSWKSIMELHMRNREHVRMILESVKHGPLIWPTIEENGVTRTKKYEELSATEKIQADCDLKATNIILQGLPSYVYSLVNHHRVCWVSEVSTT